MYWHTPKGFSLIEVLVALLILSVGLLGLAAMQVSGLRSVGNSTYYTQASLALTDMAERMRANPVAVADNFFLDVSSDSTDGAAKTIDCAPGSKPTPYCSDYYDTDSSTAKDAATCTPTELATYDINVWFCGELTQEDGGGRTGSLAAALPSAKVTIKCEDSDAGVDSDDCTAGSTHEIVLTWDELSQQDNTSVSKTLSMTIQP
jgi:type IV pilus assembly protein PilV